MKKGFTLIEMMIVVAIIGILLVLFIPRITKSMDRSRERTAMKNLKSIKLALDQYAEQPDGSYIYPATKEEANEILKEAFTDGIVPRAVLRLSSTVPVLSDCYVTGSTTDIPVSGGGGWVFISAGPYRGNVYINSIENSVENSPYTTYSCW